MFFFFRAVKKGIDVESGELSQSPVECSFLSRMRFLAVGIMLQLAAFTITCAVRFCTLGPRPCPRRDVHIAAKLMAEIVILVFGNLADELPEGELLEAQVRVREHRAEEHHHRGG